MDAFIVYPNAYTCLGDSEQLWKNLLQGNCGLSPVNTVFHDYFPDNSSKIGALKQLSNNNSRLPQILLHIEELLIPREADICQLILGASSLGDLEGKFAGDPYGCIAHYFQEKKSSIANIFSGVISSACSSGTDVLSLAAIMVHQQKYDAIGVLAVDCLDHGKLLQHVALGTQGQDRARPFDINRSGTSFGEGGAFAMVVNSNGLKKLNADHVYKIHGFGMSCDAQHVTAPDQTGAIPALAISRALSTSGLSVHDVGYINAHASGTPINDQVESVALHKVFGKALEGIAVNGTKGAIGHLLGATGLVEAVLTCWSLLHRHAPGTVGLENKDQTLSLPVTPGGSAKKIPKPIGLSITFGFGGVNSAIVIESLN